MLGLDRARARGWKRQATVILKNPSNRGHRWSIVGQVLRFEFNARRRLPTRVTLGHSMMIDAYKSGDSSARVPFARLPDWPAMEIWREWLRLGDTFVDVGANVGLYSLIAMECDSSVIAVEPAPDMAKRLRDHLRLNGCVNAVVHECALMDVPGRVELRGPDANRRSARRTTGDVGVEARTLDDLIGEIDVRGVKIDVEGNERLVLEGSQALLADARLELIQLEWNSTSATVLGEDRRPLAALLQRFGFSLFQIEGSRLVGPLREPGFGGDVFAARHDAIAFVSAWV